MNKRAERVIRAFINCVKNGEFTIDYAITLIENDERYGYLTEADKNVFYVSIEEQELLEGAEV